MSALTSPLLPVQPGAPERSFAEQPVWSSVDDGFWVASAPRGFVGTVELVDGGFVAVDAIGIEIGRYDELADAQSAVVEPSSRGYRRRLMRQERERQLAVAAAIVGGVSCIASTALILLGAFA